ncbi:MAG: methionyl-tRNA formyltransferase [Bacteroidetes bacterium HGW-Bacteroidetes-4]|jgi:methionyl-tRNA formyltransferase|nr:MAG: methionyl-tRNA formyltransferase [Bacteroidetes bacterium HGW-Bacteroidetes-4]
MNKADFRIVFMGTPDFAVESLKTLVENGYQVVGVVTASDKPAGRGQKLQQSAVKKYAEQQGFTVLQPEKLKNPAFLGELRQLNAHLNVIVAFRMLPESVWNMPTFGSINLHGSLLPHYRGAAPINWAIINGEQKTGVTTFFLKHEIDTGNILFQEAIPIAPNDTAGYIHDQLMYLGAKLMVKTVQSIIDNNYQELPQSQIAENRLKQAPKLFKDDCRVNWEVSGFDIHNLIRGLSPHPAAWSEFLKPDGSLLPFKIYLSTFENHPHNLEPGTLIIENKTQLKIVVIDGYIYLHEIQLSGKKRMSVTEVLRGMPYADQLKLNR